LSIAAEINRVVEQNERAKSASRATNTNSGQIGSPGSMQGVKSGQSREVAARSLHAQKLFERAVRLFLLIFISGSQR
jgi:hypothetical protein